MSHRDNGTHTFCTDKVSIYVCALYITNC